MERHPFRLAVERDDLAAVHELLHEDVEFRSPAVHRPYHGREVVAHLLAHAKATLEGLTYIDELHGEGSVALVFTARVGDRDVEGLDHLTFDGDGRITRFRVMIRPLSGLIAVAQTMGARLEEDPPPGLRNDTVAADQPSSS
jgi:ketosteroid isomerase-like protein